MIISRKILLERQKIKKKTQDKISKTDYAYLCEYELNGR